MKQLSGNIQIVFYLLGALILAIFCFSLAVWAHQDQVEGAAQAPRYKADCSGALWYSSAMPETPCYDIQTYVVLTEESGKRALNHYGAELTLPNGSDITSHLVGEQPTKLISGSYTVEIWHGKLTQILYKNQVLQTEDNPIVKGQGDGGVMVTIPVIAGIVCTLFVMVLSAVFVKGLQDRQ